MDKAHSSAEALKQESWDDGDFYDVSFGINKSRRYHAKMRDFYNGWHYFIVVLTAVTGTSAFAFLSADVSYIAKWLTAVIALASVVNLVLGFSKKAGQHEELGRRFTELAARMAEWDANDRNLRRARAERFRIEAEEPSSRRLVDLEAHNDELRSRGVPIKCLLPLSIPQRLFSRYATFGLHRLEQRIEKQQEHQEIDRADVQPA